MEKQYVVVVVGYTGAKSPSEARIQMMQTVDPLNQLEGSLLSVRTFPTRTLSDGMTEYKIALRIRVVNAESEPLAIQLVRASLKLSNYFNIFVEDKVFKV